MKAGEVMNNDGRYLLNELIEAEYHYRLLIEEYEEEREVILAGHYPGYETRWGNIEMETISTENVVLYILELEERIKSYFLDIKDQKTLYEKSLSILTEKEKHYFNHIVWNEALDHGLNEIELAKISKEINNKLCLYLESREIKWGKAE